MKPLVYKKAKRVRRPVPTRMKLRITKGDTVQVISGEEKGKQGKVLQVFPKTGRIKVQGVNVVKRHLRASPTAEGGIVEREAPIHHAVQAIDFVGIALDAIRHNLGCKGPEVVCLAGHRTEGRHLPIQPLQDIVTAVQVVWQQLPGFLSQILQDRAGFEN